MKKRKNLPRDPNQRARAILDIATGETEIEPEPEKDQRAVELGRLGGLKGGKARAAKLSAEQRRAIAQRAAQARWSKREQG